VFALVTQGCSFYANCDGHKGVAIPSFVLRFWMSGLYLLVFFEVVVVGNLSW